MYNHAPGDYKCPICLAVQGIENDDTWIKQADIFYKDDLVMGFISSKFVKGNEGHPLVVPLQHFENIYDQPDEYGRRVIEIARRTAIALKEIRQCAGVNILQNNEPAADQHAFHYHLHVIPRFEGDDFYVEMRAPRKSDPAERVDYATDLRDYFSRT